MTELPGTGAVAAQFLLRVITPPPFLGPLISSGPQEMLPMPRTDRISELSLHHSWYRSNTRITAPPRSLTDHITRRAVTATAAHRRLKIITRATPVIT